MNPLLKSGLLWAASHLLAVAGAVGLVYGVLVGEHSKKLLEAQDKLAAAQVAAEAEKRGAVEGKLVAALSLSVQQSEFIKALQKIDSRVKVVEQSKTTAIIEDKPAGHVDSAAAPTVWQDNDGPRFTLNLKTWEFTRRQEFVVAGVVAAGVAGQRIEKIELHEFNPVTHAEIPLTGVSLQTEFQFVKDAVGALSRWHLYGVVGVDHRLAFGLGAQLEPLRHFAVSVLGIYSTKDKEGRGVVGLGYRPGSWTIALGPYLGYSTKRLWAGGLMATIRVWGDAR